MAVRALALLVPLATALSELGGARSSRVGRPQDVPSLEDLRRDLRAVTSSFYPTGRSSLAPFGGWGSPAPLEGPRPTSYDVKTLRSFEHPHAPWTQGLEFSSEGRLVETCGDFPKGVGSSVRILDPESGKLQRSVSDGLVDEAGNSRFIEGIVEREGRWYATTYHDRLAIEYDNDFKVVGTHRYPFNGWGLAVSSNGQSFLATNGTEYVMSLRVGTWELEGARVAHCMGRRVGGLNELEMVEDLAGTGPALLGNLVNTRLVLAMDPKTMTCTGVFHLEDTEPVEQNERLGYHVANGIAYNKKTRSFFITGKNWKSMYEVNITKSSSSKFSGAGHGARAIEMLESHLTFADRYDAPLDPSTPV